jgi:hypothetical protein
MLQFVLPGTQMLRDALGRQLPLLSAVVILGLSSAALEGAGIGLVIPMPVMRMTREWAASLLSSNKSDRDWMMENDSL